MNHVIESSVPGNKGLSLRIARNNIGTDELPEVFLIRDGLAEAGRFVPGIVLNQSEAYEAIVAIAGEAGLDLSEAVGGGGIVVRKPKDPVEESRREDVAAEIFGYPFGGLDSLEQKAVRRILELEKQAGVKW